MLQYLVIQEEKDNSNDLFLHVLSELQKWGEAFIKNCEYQEKIDLNSWDALPKALSFRPHHKLMYWWDICIIFGKLHCILF